MWFLSFMNYRYMNFNSLLSLKFHITHWTLEKLCPLLNDFSKFFCFTLLFFYMFIQILLSFKDFFTYRAWDFLFWVWPQLWSLKELKWDCVSLPNMGMPTANANGLYCWPEPSPLHYRILLAMSKTCVPALPNSVGNRFFMI